MSDAASESTPPKRRRSKRRLAFVIIMLPVLLLLIVLIPGAFDSDPIDASEFDPPPWPTVPAELNVFTDVLAVHRLLNEPEEFFSISLRTDSRESDAVDSLHHWVDSNGPFYEELLVLLERPHCVPAEPVRYDEPRPEIIALAKMAPWVEFRRDSLILRGQTREAVDLALLWARVARECLEHSPSLKGLLVSLALYEAAVGGLAICAGADGVDALTLVALANQAGHDVDVLAAYQRTIPYEYRQLDQTLDAEAEQLGGAMLFLTYKPHRTRGLIADVLRATRTSTSSGDAEPLKAVHRRLADANQVRVALGGNWFGWTGARGVAKAFTKTFEGIREKKARLILPQACIALRRYEVAYGELPATLDLLVPEFIAEDRSDLLDNVVYERDARWLGFTPRKTEAGISEYPPLPAPFVQWDPSSFRS